MNKRTRFVRSNRFGPAIYDKRRKSYAAFFTDSEREMRLCELHAGELIAGQLSWIGASSLKAWAESEDGPA